ncbi:MAG: aminopeptidase [Flavobacteriales bacterium]|jgi:putative aminopeptidase FrvX
MKLLEKLISIRGASGDESRMKEFILEFVQENKSFWKVQPEIIAGDEMQDTLVLVFGNPTTAIYAHTDSIGFSVGYDKDLIKIGGPKLIDGTMLVGKDSNGEIEVEMVVYEDEFSRLHPQYLGDRILDRGTVLTYKPNFRETEKYVQSPYMDNRLGVWTALQVASTLENGAIVFSTYEEHGGNSVGFCARLLWEKHKVRQALIADITWVTDGVKHGGGVAVSIRDKGLPRRKYLDKIIALARESKIPFQLEVESAGGSDGGVLQESDLLIDWCFIGAAEDNVHTPDEKVFKNDIESMVKMYSYLMEKL